MLADNTLYLALFAFMCIYGLLVPIVFVVRYRYYIRQFDMTVYQKRFRVGFPLTGVGFELTAISFIMASAWLLEWPPLRQDQWLILLAVIYLLGFLCLLVGMTSTAEGFRYLRSRSRHRRRRHSLNGN